MTSFDKVHRRILRKRNHNNRQMDSLHVNSRDSKRLHGAQIRDSKIAKIASARRKGEKSRLARVEFFQNAIKEKEADTLTPEEIHDLINTFVHRLDEGLAELKKQRQPNKPPSPREELLKLDITTLMTEQKDGFLIPDLTSAENVLLLTRWEGSWAYLSNLQWVRFMAAGTSNPASFPPR